MKPLDSFQNSLEQLDLQGLLTLQGILLQRSLDIVQTANKVQDTLPKVAPKGLILPNPTIF